MRAWKRIVFQLIFVCYAQSRTVEVPCTGSLHEARDKIREWRRTGVVEIGETCFIEIAPNCLIQLQSVLELTELDSNLQINAGKGTVISGGYKLSMEFDAEYLVPGEDEVILNLLPEHARSQVKKLRAPDGAFGSMSSIGAFNGFSQLRLDRAKFYHRGYLYFATDNGKTPSTVPARFAQYPNIGGSGESQKYIKAKKQIDRYSLEMEASNRTRKWKDELKWNSNVWTHGYWKYRWADAHFKLVSITDHSENDDEVTRHISDSQRSVDMGNQEASNVSIEQSERFEFDVPTSLDHTLLVCSGDCELSNNAEFYVSNLLSELDQPGEYVMDFSTNMLYTWPEFDQRGELQDAFVVSASLEALVEIQGAHNVTMSNLHFRHSAGNGIVVRNSRNVAMLSGSVSQIALSAVNVTDGYNNSIANVEIFHAGTTGVVLEGGDRVMLRPSNHQVKNCHIHNNNLLVTSFSAGIVLSGVGNRATKNTVRNGPGHAVWIQGNNHDFSGNTVDTFCYEMDDAAALYSGRDFTYHGNRITHNTFSNIYTRASHTSLYVQAIYLDDRVSGFHISNNYFVNVSQALLLGGGRENVFRNNIIEYDPAFKAIAKHTRQMIWIDQRGYKGDKHCEPNSGAMRVLNRVPYRSALWVKAYGPLLSEILDDDCALAYYNKFVNNCLVTTSDIPYSNFDTKQLSESLRGEWRNNIRVSSRNQCTTMLSSLNVVQ